MKTALVALEMKKRLTYGSFILAVVLAISITVSPWVSASQTPESNPPQVEAPIPAPSESEPTEPIVPQPVETIAPQPAEPSIPQPVETPAPQPAEPVVPQPIQTDVPQPVETVAVEPPPTLVPVPTEVQVIPPTPLPESISVTTPAPTDVPVTITPEQTETPTAEVASEQPTETVLEKTPAPPATPGATEAPSPTPSPEPPIPFDPNVSCMSAPGNAAPVAGDEEWAYLDCAVDWETESVASVSLLPVDAAAKWEIVPLNDPARQDADQEILNPKPLNLIDTTPGDDEFASSRFHLAIRVSCLDETAVTVPLKFQATSGEDSLQEVSTENLPMSATAATLPEVTLTSAVFEDANPPDGTDVSIGAIAMDYNNASENCGWKITTSVEDFVADADVLSASDLTLVDVVGPVGLTSSIENGEITLYAAPGVAVPASGTITITVSMPIPETVSSGVYSTTITAKAVAP